MGIFSNLEEVAQNAED